MTNKATLKLVFWMAVVGTTAALLLPGDALLAAKVWVAAWLPYAQTLDESNITDHSDKWVHFALFALLGALAARIWWGLGVFKAVVLGLVLLGVGTECMQHFIPGRGASVADFLADVAGLLLGSALVQRRGAPVAARA